MLEVSDTDLLTLKKAITADCEAQMKKDPSTRCRMLETFINKLPDGTEHGEYIVLDFGGKFFRVVYVKLNHQALASSDGRRCSIAPEQCVEFDVDPTESVYMESMIYPLNSQILALPYNDLFGYIAKSCHDFCTRFKLLSRPLDVVMVNSFPCRHTSLKSSSLIRWTKTLNCPGAVDQDFGKDLQSAISAAGLPHQVVALVNDSVACLFTGMTEDTTTRIGLIIGTGFNLSFLRNVEEEQDVFTETSNTSSHCSHSSVVINAELGSFGDSGELDQFITPFDRMVIDGPHFLHKGEQTFEKLVTGNYITEIFRVICKSLVDDKVLFNGISSDILDKPGAIPQNFLSQIVRAGESGLNHVQDVLINMDICAMYADADAVLKISKALILRSAALISAALAGVITVSCPSQRKIALSVDGTMYKSYPLLSKHIARKTTSLLSPNHELHFRTCFDGSAKGAAFISAKNVAA